MTKLKLGSKGSSLESLLKEEGIYEDCQAQAIKEVLAWQLLQEMEKKGLTKVAMAERMKTSRTSLDRLLDPNNTAVTLHTLTKAAASVGKSIRVEIVG